MLTPSYYVRGVPPRRLSTGEMARELGVSRGAVLAWATADPPLITPAFITPGGHYRWDPDDVVRQLREARERDD